MSTVCHRIPPPYQNRETCWFHAILVCLGFSETLGVVVQHMLSDRWRALPEFLQDVLMPWFEVLKTFQNITIPNNNRAFRHLPGLLRNQYAMTPPEVILESLHTYDPRAFPLSKKLSAPFGVELDYLLKMLVLLGVPQDHILVKNHEKWNKLWSPFIRTSSLNTFFSTDKNPPDPSKYDIVIVRSNAPGDHPVIKGFELDCCLLTNYNVVETQLKTGTGHEIAGITCRGKKFVFNGWIVNNWINSGPEACSLWEYDWILNPSSCLILQPMAPGCSYARGNARAGTPFCYNFNMGYRLLIYVSVRSFHRALRERFNVNLR